jgi:hypothetical protein
VFAKGDSHSFARAAIACEPRELTKQATGRGGAEGVAATAELKRLQAELLQIRLKREQGKYLDADDVRACWTPILIGLRQGVLSLPGRVAFEIPTLTTHDRCVMERIHRDFLEDCALGRGYAVLGPGARCGECGRLHDGQPEGNGHSNRERVDYEDLDN